MITAISKIWKRQSFRRQLQWCFFIIILFQIVVVEGISTIYINDYMKDRIEESYQNSLRQTALTMSSSMTAYKKAIDELFRNADFISAVAALNDIDLKEASTDEEWKTKEQLDDIMKEFMIYRSEIRNMSIRTTTGNVYGYDRQMPELWYPQLSEVHEKYYAAEEFEDKSGLKGKWEPTEYLDRIGTIEYYVFSYGKQVVNLYTNRQVGTGIVSIEESVLNDICTDGQINEDRSVNYLFLTDENGRIISHYDKSRIGRKVEEEILEKQQEEDHYLILSETVSPVGFRLYSVLNERYIFERLYKLQRMVTLASVLVAAAVFLIMRYISGKMSGAIQALLQTMTRVQEGSLDAKAGIDQDEKNEISQIADHFNVMMKKVNEQMQMVREAGIREKDAEIRALEAQINPHFIYNTLDTINWMAIENDEQEISEMLSRFAQILRFQIQKSNQIITIREEIAYLEQYLYLQKVRFMDNFEYLIECQETIKNCCIHKMLFQPFVENAIIHGLAQKEYGGWIKILVHEKEDGFLTFVISDNGCGMTQEQIHSLFEQRVDSGKSIGIRNVLSRMDLYYGNRYLVSVQSELDRGTVIEVTFPRQTG